ncbi:NAD(P)H-dependent glycerol-3-phosphate dehydrogenase [Loktanella sp. SALINAS62]|uniref:NAD(P)H-dependent glycerol-3-phosphate dehydrogenase n=1 Tax=Loktanella sp. SALINAS62 TaxID=2706124 RepID=UPI001B8B6883|nr:NAD(P)H-dependent glycerol-3-phosphate dehydrogenase [Loktanella sp. SALINAS62]MBS1302418.1 NAD(P)-dependent glycerol-3-phosphate dehydrogenase [Loktanella sp. SALINAS62]
MIGIMGAGAFGTALAIALAQDGRDVTLWARTTQDLISTRRSAKLDVPIPDTVRITDDVEQLGSAECVLMAIPAQTLRPLLQTHATVLCRKRIVACCKGIDLETLTGPVAGIRATLPDATAAILTGPSFAADIARGLPTALTLACADGQVGAALQSVLSTRTLRLYRTTDTIGAELGGALKNVIAIACGVAIGAGLGDSARAALMTRGFAEMQRLAAILGADPQTLNGLSGLGDLALTCTSDLSRNYRHGIALGSKTSVTDGVTVEGAATSIAVANLGRLRAVDLPVCAVVADLCAQKISVEAALQTLLSRPLKEE